jgi:AbiV family abortive infection protein
MNEKNATRQIARYARASLSNGIALTENAIAVYEHRSWGTAYFLATIAMEEVAKCFLANDVIFNRQVNNHKINDCIDWLRIARDHKWKHYKFVCDGIHLLPIEFLQQVLDHQLDTTKQKALYVDIELQNRNNLLQVSTPRKVSEAKARKQISIVHESILDLISNTLKGNYILEMGDELPPIDKKTLRKVRAIWTMKYKARKTSLYELEKQKRNRA